MSGLIKLSSNAASSSAFRGVREKARTIFFLQEDRPGHLWNCLAACLWNGTKLILSIFTHILYDVLNFKRALRLCVWQDDHLSSGWMFEYGCNVRFAILSARFFSCHV